MLKKVIASFWQCSHEFGWPRRDASGRHYQVCLRCGVEYAYDWSTMKRLEMTAHPKPAKKHPARAHHTQLTWRPRDRRMPWRSEIQFRHLGAQQWNHGRVENISRTGLVFDSDHTLERNTPLEMILEMPSQLTGQEHSKVLCQGIVARSVPGTPARIAIQIEGYVFLHDLVTQDETQSILTS